MIVHVLLDLLLNELGKSDKNARLAEHFIAFFTTRLIKSILQENKC